MTPDFSVSRDIAASPATVFSTITDITRMGEWSPENHACEWNEGSDAAVVGAEWTGHNRHGENEWTTQARVTEIVPNERFYFECFVGDFVFAKWGYDIAATDNGCRVTEHTQDLRPESVLEMSKSMSGVEDRAAHNKAGMEQTLERVAAAVQE